MVHSEKAGLEVWKGDQIPESVLNLYSSTLLT